MHSEAHPRTLEEAGEYYRALLRPVFEGRRIILVGAPLAGFKPLALQLRALGAERPFLLGSGSGTGDLPNPSTPSASLDIRAPDMIAEIHTYEAALERLPPKVLKAIEAYDPERRACALGALVMGPLEGVAGRPLYGRREPRWAELEDKTVIGALWDALDVPRAPSRVVAAEPSAMAAARAELERGSGVVLAGDTREGHNGGGIFVRWVCDDAEAREAAAFFAGRCDRVRVMPFLEGIPCSIHGLVFPETTVVLRPIEGVNLRSRDPHRIRYTGMASYWDPSPGDREAIRDLARHVGEALRERVGYRGGFTIDGVLTAEGFRPTELNARVGAGLALIARSLPALPLLPLALAVQAGESLDYRPAWLEERVLAAADAERAGSAWCTLPGEAAERLVTRLCGDPAKGYREAAEDEEEDASVSCGPSNVGGFVRFEPRRERVPLGPSFAPFAVAGLTFADRSFGLGIGPLEAAREVR